jgi:hypothetical protein
MTSQAPSPSRAVQQPRVRLQQDTVTKLVEWQLGALQRGWSKPTYGELLDAVVAIVGERGSHPLDLLGEIRDMDGVALAKAEGRTLIGEP